MSIQHRPARWRAVLAVLTCALLAAACGQKGDLYYPGVDPVDEIEHEEHF